MQKVEELRNNPPKYMSQTLIITSFSTVSSCRHTEMGSILTLQYWLVMFIYLESNETYSFLFPQNLFYQNQKNSIKLLAF